MNEHVLTGFQAETTRNQNGMVLGDRDIRRIKAADRNEVFLHSVLVKKEETFRASAACGYHKTCAGINGYVVDKSRVRAGQPGHQSECEGAIRPVNP